MTVDTFARCDGCGWPLHPTDSGMDRCLYCRQPDHDVMVRAMIGEKIRALPETTAKASRDFGRGYALAIKDAAAAAERNDP
jgi:hypothetical protein